MRVEKSRALEFEAPECERCGQELGRGSEAERSLATLRLSATNLIVLEKRRRPVGELKVRG